MVTPRGVLGTDPLHPRTDAGRNSCQALARRNCHTTKVDTDYGQLVGPALLKTYPGTTAIFSVGDSTTSDGGGCSWIPRRRHQDGLLLLQSKTPRSIGGSYVGRRFLFLGHLDRSCVVSDRKSVGVEVPTTLLTVDLDNTFWTPSGLNDRVAVQVRQQAALKLLTRDTSRYRPTATAVFLGCPRTDRNYQVCSTDRRR